MWHLAELRLHQLATLETFGGVYWVSRFGSHITSVLWRLLQHFFRGTPALWQHFFRRIDILIGQPPPYSRLTLLVVQMSFWSCDQEIIDERCYFAMP